MANLGLPGLCSVTVRSSHLIYRFIHSLLILAYENSSCLHDSTCHVSLYHVRTSFRMIYYMSISRLAFPQFFTPLLLPSNDTIIITGLNFALITLSGIISCRFVLNIRSCDDSPASFHSIGTISQMRFDHDDEGVELRECIRGSTTIDRTGEDAYSH